ncbi:lysM and putative peptidoglycan-binding domain-containing protein 4 [Rhineura floridana]|uniref:lysM and putative peptidoglycan-binding domain-containing protein 4 n=1 Tax=Rhineura floridana TaxID=261503 RepID=UPI002AC89039|nr:lysM and putative peptidoglycan-binding domain-containing protein 4 [Rhineura floridana]XP_061451285.1 lysM and putative peptidoglycan-binding domain-containing protein 4 [Rhineura floridana]XP_061451286.1 lysM and putative peptidoglycan-binding domain-containing protein 4 [Rhineura floridana]XP_061451287.1 lysM and putative peptidoglycan-binding domain-containing protein 4 [Rhineura floridana]XP_061451288.1 lysM and putative peptidoglycan-binding domain-containing protein 4 [Rhineura florid
MRLPEGLTRSFQAPSTVRKFTSSQVYLFRNRESDTDDSSSEEELDIMGLRARGKEQQRCNAAREKVGDVVLLERAVGKDDSLNKLALQYGCKVGDIKRVNNFIQEQDLYALKSIKIPVKVNGVLTETQEEFLPPERASLLSTELSGSKDEVGGEDMEHIDQYFRGIDHIVQAAQLEASPSTDYCIETPNWSSPGRKGTSSGVDCGIQWWNAVFVMLLVGIVLPVFYIVYFKTQQLTVAAATSNATVPANSSLDGLTRGTLVHPAEGEHPITSRTPKGGDFIPPGG